MFTLVLLAYVCIAAPLIICFGIEYDWLDWLGWIEIIVETAFCMDVRHPAHLMMLLCPT